tara:strand:- start:349 stop:945 length:597 start_codon:yes stop_codon:yes gene_type:complete
MNFDVPEVVIDKLVRSFGLQEWEYNLEDLVEDIADAMKLIGAEKVFSVRTCEIKVCNGTAKLPRDLESIKTLIPVMTYSHVGQFIQIDLPTDSVITLCYQAMPVDERGFVLIPDNAAVREAVMWYLAKYLVLRGVVKTVNYPFAEAEWQFRCGSARADLNVMSFTAWSKVQQDFVSLSSSSSIDPNIRYVLDREKNRL